MLFQNLQYSKSKVFRLLLEIGRANSGKRVPSSYHSMIIIAKLTESKSVSIGESCGCVVERTRAVHVLQELLGCVV